MGRGLEQSDQELNAWRRSGKDREMGWVLWLPVTSGSLYTGSVSALGGGQGQNWMPAVKGPGWWEV